MDVAVLPYFYKEYDGSIKKEVNELGNFTTDIGAIDLAQYDIAPVSYTHLTLMLYEGAIKFCNIAMIAIEKGDLQKAHTNIKKAEDIITEFKVTLNHKYPVAEDFEKIYDYIYSLLVNANVKKDPEILNQALVEIRGMRDTWKEVMNRTRGMNQ